MSSLLLEYPAEGAWLLRIHRPERRNALDAGLIAELRSVLAAADGDARCRVLVIAASGMVFCSGADLDEMADGGTATAALAAFLLELHQHRCPSIAKVHGPALGGGVGLVAACDVAIAAPGARFRLPEVRIGVLPAIISPYLARAMGARRALRRALDGEWFDAGQALAEGLLHEVVPAEQLAARAVELAAAIAAGEPGALRRCKQVFDGPALEPPGPASAARLAAEFAAAIGSPEAQQRLAQMPGRVPGPASGRERA